MTSSCLLHPQIPIRISFLVKNRKEVRTISYHNYWNAFSVTEAGKQNIETLRDSTANAIKFKCIIDLYSSRFDFRYRRTIFLFLYPIKQGEDYETWETQSTAETYYCIDKTTIIE